MSSNSGDPADGDVQIAQAAGDGVRDAGRVRLALFFQAAGGVEGNRYINHRRTAQIFIKGGIWSPGFPCPTLVYLYPSPLASNP